ncbi:Crp/Fnr family transcriptional regulator [Microcoleus sp. FACHB-68]|uniref:Crp/Fnr family transcriptional regulator n=1 Tax=Microcoleus sp. FACHB-68 TaxID=2692826 RepID=UPI001686376D|nr:Crp/Fnr family transcriptional regulator [Microcoleus sp. FACHB-68]MBD1939798.1 Crp/Fnr family transcriptional regulator [Microcoleus sp. FACHB-68]
MIVSPVLLDQYPNRTQTTFARRSLLPLKPHEIWQIKTGVVRTFTWSEDGTLIPLGLWGSQDIVGKALSKAEPYTIECLTLVEATVLPANNSYEFIKALIQHTQQLEEFLELRHCKPIDASLLKLLTWLSQRFGRAVEQGQLIDLRLTHQEISEMIGSNRVTVTRMLKNFEKQGLISRHQQRYIVVPDRQPFWHYEI